MNDRIRDPFTLARKKLEDDHGRGTLSAREHDLLATLGPDGANNYYADGSVHAESALHARALSVLRAHGGLPCRLPFEVRVPRGWLSKVAGTHRATIDQLDASRAIQQSAAVASWFGEPYPLCPHGQACTSYQREVAHIRSGGHSGSTLRNLILAAERTPPDEDADLLLRYARAVCVGVGRTRDKTGTLAAEELSAKWLDRYSDQTPGRTIDRANLLRSVAFAQLLSHGPSTALATAREAASTLHSVERCSDDNTESLRFRVEEALFPALETLALCEERWGSVEDSLAAAWELTTRFPYDSRAWIRLAKSRWITGDALGAIDSLLRGAASEHPKWLYCVLTARLIARTRAPLSRHVDDFVASYRLSAEQRGLL